MRNRGSIFWLLFCMLTAVYGQSLSTPGQSTTATYGDRLIYGAIRQNQFSINPFEIDSDIQKTAVQLVFGYGLLKTPGKIAAPPTLIEKHFASADFRIWRILIKRSVVFQNNQILRNADVRFTFNLLRRFGGHVLNRRLDFKNISNIETNGDLEVIFTLKEPDENFLETLADVPIVSADYYAEMMTLGYRLFDEIQPMGMGPFQIVYQTRDLIMLRYHLQYIYGRPFLEEIRLRFYNDEQSLIDALVNGEIDYIEFPDRNTTDRLLELMRTRINVFLTPRPEAKLYVLLFNVQHGALKDASVRRAINLAIHKENIVERFAKSIGEVSHSLFPDDSPHFKREFFTDRYRPRESIQLLKATGWQYNRQSMMIEKNGQPLTFKLFFAENSELEQNLARAIKLNLAEINVNVQPFPVSPDAKDRLLSNSEYEAMIYSYTYDPDYPFSAAEDFFENVLGAEQNVPNYRNAYLSQLFDLVRDVPAKHENALERLQYYLNRETPATFLFFDNDILIGLDKRFASFRDVVRTRDKRMFFRLNPIENWFVPKNLQKYP